MTSTNLRKFSGFADSYLNRYIEFTEKLMSHLEMLEDRIRLLEIQVRALIPKK